MPHIGFGGELIVEVKVGHEPFVSDVLAEINQTLNALTTVSLLPQLATSD